MVRGRSISVVAAVSAMFAVVLAVGPAPAVADTGPALPGHRLVFVERTIVPPGNTQCGATYLTTLAVADSIGGANRKVLYSDTSPCVPIGTVSVNPQRTKVAFTIGGQLYLLDINAALAGTATPRGFTERFYCDVPQWNADGSRLLCRSSGSLLVIAADTLHLLGTVPAADYGIFLQDADWLPNGDILLGGASSSVSCPHSWGTSLPAGVWHVQMNGAQPGTRAAVLPPVCATAWSDGVIGVRVSPTGNQFAYLGPGGAGNAGSALRIAGIDGTGDHQLAPATPDTSYGRFAWSPSGQYLIGEVFRSTNNVFGLTSNLSFLNTTTGLLTLGIGASGQTDFLAPASAEPSDITPPTVTGAPDRPANAAGWYKAPVTVTWSVTDPAPSSGTPTAPPATTVDTDGAGQTAHSAPVCDAAGNCTTGTYGPLNIDQAPPAVVTQMLPAANGNGWTNRPVTISFTCTDSLSGIRSCPAPVTITDEGYRRAVSGTAADNADNEVVATTTVNIDTTAPDISASLSQPINANGWNNADVTVSFACTDALSGIASCPAPVTVDTEGAGQLVAATAVDAAGNTSTITVTVSVDKTKPTITATRTEANAAGWNNTPVVVEFHCADAVSAITSCTPAVTVTDDGAQQSVTGTAVDQAGNTATAIAGPISIDTAPPTVTAVIVGNPTVSGWYAQAPTIHYTCVDTLSAIATCPADITIATDGTNQAVSQTATDNAANTAIAVVTGLDVDLTAPLVSVGGIINGNSYPLNAAPTPTCIATDAVSGVAQPPTLTLTRTANGTYTATCVGAVDIAGNSAAAATATYTVQPTSTSLTALGDQYIAGSGSPNTNGVVNDLDNHLRHEQFCLYIDKVRAQTSGPHPTLTTAQADELIYWATILSNGC